MQEENSAPAAPPEIKYFFSRNANLIININKGKQVMQEGQLVRFGEKSVEFTPMNNGFGRFVTSDPEIIANLLKRGDVMTLEAYTDAVTPQEEKIRIQDRKITEQNELIAKLQADAARAKSSKPQTVPAA